LGNLLHELGRKTEAEEQYRLAIKADPKFALAYSNLGNLLHELGQKTEAEKQYVWLSSRSEICSATLCGNLLSELARRRKLRTVRLAIKADPNDALAHLILGSLLDDLGRKAEAEDQYRLAIKADPDLAGAYYDLGNLLSELGQKTEAEEQYRLAIKVDRTMLLLITTMQIFCENWKVQRGRKRSQNCLDIDPLSLIIWALMATSRGRRLAG